MKASLQSIALAFFLFVLSCPATAQDGNRAHLLDSMEAIVDTIRDDSAWMGMLLDICVVRRKADLKDGLACFKEGVEQARERNFPVGVANFLMRTGQTYELMGEFAIEITQYQEAMRIFEAIDDTSGIAGCYNSLGNLYNSLSDYEIALDYHRKALQLRQKLGQEKLIAGTYNNIGNTYLSQKKYQEALHYYVQAKEINEQINSRDFLSSNYSNIGLVYTELGEYRKAIEYHERALELREKMGNNLAVAGSKIYMGTAYGYLGENVKATALIQAGMQVAIASDAKSLQERGYHGLYRTWKAMGQYQKALQAHEDFVELSDSLRSDEVAGKVARAQIQIETERQQREKELLAQNNILRAEADRDRDRYYFFLAIAGAAGLLLLVLLVAIFFALRYRAKKRSEAILEAHVTERTLALQQANDELGKFIYQSSHDMRSPLTSIKGLASIAMSVAGEGQEREYIDLIMGRVNHLDGVYTGLIEFMNVKERQPKLEQVPLGDLQQSLVATMEQKRGDIPIRLNFDFPKDARPVTDEFLLRAILQSLVLNAIDFRDETKDAECTVRFHQNGIGWEVEVADNGLGIASEFMPKAFDMFARGSNKSRGSGLGLYTARLAATKLGGRLELDSEAGKRTVAKLLIIN